MYIYIYIFFFFFLFLKWQEPHRLGGSRDFGLHYQKCKQAIHFFGNNPSLFKFAVANLEMSSVILFNKDGFLALTK